MVLTLALAIPSTQRECFTSSLMRVAFKQPLDNHPEGKTETNYMVEVLDGKGAVVASKKFDKVAHSPTIKLDIPDVPEEALDGRVRIFPYTYSNKKHAHVYTELKCDDETFDTCSKPCGTGQRVKEGNCRSTLPCNTHGCKVKRPPTNIERECKRPSYGVMKNHKYTHLRQDVISHENNKANATSKCASDPSCRYMNYDKSTFKYTLLKDTNGPVPSTNHDSMWALCKRDCEMSGRRGCVYKWNASNVISTLGGTNYRLAMKECKNNPECAHVSRDHGTRDFTLLRKHGGESRSSRYAFCFDKKCK